MSPSIRFPRSCLGVGGSPAGSRGPGSQKGAMVRMWPQRPNVANHWLKATSAEQNGDLTPVSRFPTQPPCLALGDLPPRQGVGHKGSPLSPASCRLQPESPEDLVTTLFNCSSAEHNFLVRLTHHLHFPCVLERLGTRREGAQGGEEEREWPLIRAGSSLPVWTED